MGRTIMIAVVLVILVPVALQMLGMAIAFKEFFGMAGLR